MLTSADILKIKMGNFYKKFGFKIIGRMKRYYMSGDDALTMRANLEDLKC